MSASFWHEWRGSLDGRPTFYIRRVFNLFGVRVDLHKMVGADDADCYHTHPAYALRFILWGGYVEELDDGHSATWRPGMVGLVKPTHCHRISAIRNGRSSLSLWVRFRRCAEIELRGDGWERQRALLERAEP